MKKSVLYYISHAKEIINDMKNIDLESIYSTEKEIINALNELQNDNKLMVSFLGTFSSGKSTIIKRLTGVNLETDTNPLTDKIRTIEWKGIDIIDTPGLNSTQQSHDKITEDFMSKSDIVVWVCEADRLILESHRRILNKIALDFNKEDRLIIVVNRLDETGRAIQVEEEYNEISEIKYNEMKRILGEIGINQSIPVVAISADPMAVGDGLSIEDATVEWNREDNMRMSYFENFENIFDNFIKLYGDESKYLGLYDRVNEYMDIVRKDINELTEYYLDYNKLNEITLAEYLTILKKVQLRSNTIISMEKTKTIEMFNTKFRKIVNKANGPKEMSNLNILSENYVQSTIEQCFNTSMEASFKDFDSFFNTQIDATQLKIKDSYFLKSIESKYERIETLAHTKNKSVYIRKKNYHKDHIKVKHELDLRIAKDNRIERAVFGHLKKVKPPNKVEFYHDLIYKGGKKVGYNFKPWQATKWAESATKLAKKVPLAVSAVESLLKIYNYHKEAKLFEEFEKNKIEILDNIMEIETEVISNIEEDIKTNFNNKINGLENMIETIELELKENNEIINENNKHCGLLKLLRSKRLLDFTNEGVISNAYSAKYNTC